MCFISASLYLNQQLLAQFVVTFKFECSLMGRIYHNTFNVCNSFYSLNFQRNCFFLLSLITVQFTWNFNSVLEIVKSFSKLNIRLEILCDVPGNGTHYRPHSEGMGKVMFSQASVCPHL